MLSSQDIFDKACKSGNLSKVSRLLNEGVDATADVSVGLRWAARNGHLDIVNRLLKIERVDATAYNNAAIFMAASNGHIEVVDRLLKIEGVDVAAVYNSALCGAAKNGHLKVVNWLLKIEGVDATAFDNCALRWAAQYGHLAVVNRLLGIKEVDATARNNDALRLAAEFGHLDVVNRLLGIKEVDATADDNYALRSAARNGHLAVVNHLLKIEEVDASAGDNYALRWAAMYGHLAVVNHLLKIKEVDATADDNCALRWAAQYGHLAVVARLLEEPDVLLGNEVRALGDMINSDCSILSLVLSKRPSLRTEYKKKYPNDYQALLAWRSEQRNLGGNLRRAGLLHKDIVLNLSQKYLPDSSPELIKEGFDRASLKLIAKANKKSVHIELASGASENKQAKNNPKDVQQERGHSCFSGLLSWMFGAGPQDKSKGTERDASEELSSESTQTHKMKKKPHHY